MKKETKECWVCKGTGIFEESKVKGFRMFEIKSKCPNCKGKGKVEVNVYYCKNCNTRHEEDFIIDGQCDICYADIETGKYVDDFFYIIGDLSFIKKLVNDLLKKGYEPIGRLLSNGGFSYIQAVLRKKKR